MSRISHHHAHAHGHVPTPQTPPVTRRPPTPYVPPSPSGPLSISVPQSPIAGDQYVLNVSGLNVSGRASSAHNADRGDTFASYVAKPGDKASDVQNALIGQLNGSNSFVTASRAFDVVPDDFAGQLGANQIRQSDYDAKIAQGDPSARAIVLTAKYSGADLFAAQVADIKPSGSTMVPAPNPNSLYNYLLSTGSTPEGLARLGIGPTTPWTF